MKNHTILAVCAALSGLTPCLAAQQEPTTEKPKTATVEVRTIRFLRGNDFIGKSIDTPRGENLGKVEELVLHPKGDLAFVVIAPNGALKTKQKLIPIPWSAIETNEEGVATFDIKPETFADAPGFDKDKWHNLTDLEWWMEVDKRYGRQKTSSAAVDASATLAPTKELLRSSELKARAIESPEGQKIASMHEIVIDPQADRIAYAVLSVGGMLGAGEKMIAVPWESLKVMPSKDNPKLSRLTLNATKETLEGAPEFVATSDGWSKANQPDYLMRVYEHYSVPAYWKVKVEPAEPKR
jgi:sporulation protein YlmC with PRC-barrel domain